jgi:16S rRNA (guanine1516-N2)-methyltransferase
LHEGLNTLLDLAVVATDATEPASAAALARRLGLPLRTESAAPQSAPEGMVLVLDGRRLSLRQTGRRAPGPVTVDFGASAMRHRRRSGHNELLGRAVGLGRKPVLKVLDATAGLARDAFVLADLGCELVLCERHPVVAALLEAGLDCALAQGDAWLAEVCARMRLQPVDARAVSAAVLDSVDVIYLDPMFPPRDKRAAVKKEMALFQQLLERPDGAEDSEDLLAWALDRAVARVVVKRPLRAPPLGGRRPSHELRGKAVRFDVYVLGAFTDAGNKASEDPASDRQDDGSSSLSRTRR